MLENRSPAAKLIRGLSLVAVLVVAGSAQGGTVLYSEDFEGRADGSTYAGLATVQAGEGFEGSKGVVAEYEIVRNGGSRGSNRMVRNTQFANTEFDSATLSYRIKFDNDFNTSLGGKYLGIGPTNFITGGRSLEPNGWSARVVMDDRVPYIYVYDQDKDWQFGRKVAPFDSAPLAKNEWHDISLFVKLNSTATSNDGLIQLYVNDVLRTEFANTRLREVTTTDTLPNTMLFHTFLGGASTGEYLSTEHAMFDDLRVESGLAIPGSGDFNRDGMVDAADYTVWRDSLGPIRTREELQVYGVWRDNFGAGQSSNASATSVPEPTSLLLLAGALGLALRIPGRTSQR